MEVSETLGVFQGFSVPVNEEILASLRGFQGIPWRLQRAANALKRVSLGLPRVSGGLQRNF